MGWHVITVKVPDHLDELAHSMATNAAEMIDQALHYIDPSCEADVVEQADDNGSSGAES
jgi:hypothetical protein